MASTIFVVDIAVYKDNSAPSSHHLQFVRFFFFCLPMHPYYYYHYHDSLSPLTSLARLVFVCTKQDHLNRLITFPQQYQIFIPSI